MIFQNLQQLYEDTRMVNVNSDLDSAKIMSKLTKKMDDLVKKYKSQETKADTVPAGPNTSTFSAHRGGMIDHEKHVRIHGGTYGIPVTYEEFIKIGGKVDHKIQSEIRKEFLKFAASLTKEKKIPLETMVIYAKDKKIFISSTHGTNWGGIGAYTSKFESDYRP
jgi:hypothetical protein